jgi:hypothetical protein
VDPLAHQGLDAIEARQSLCARLAHGSYAGKKGCESRADVMRLSDESNAATGRKRTPVAWPEIRLDGELVWSGEREQARTGPNREALVFGHGDSAVGWPGSRGQVSRGR